MPRRPGGCSRSMLGWDDYCQFCSIMLAVPAAIACARGGDLLTDRSVTVTATCEWPEWMLRKPR